LGCATKNSAAYSNVPIFGTFSKKVHKEKPFSHIFRKYPTMKGILRLYILIITLNLLGYPTQSQDLSQQGNRKIINFSPVHMGNLTPQNWCIASDSLGNIFVGNNKNILHFNGEQWTEIKIPGDPKVEAILIQGDRVYLGANNQFGYLYLASNGGYNYHSLSQYLPKNEQSFGRITGVFKYKEYIVFGSEFLIFEFQPQNKKLISYAFKEGFSRFDLVGKTIFVVQDYTGTVLSYQGKGKFTFFTSIPKAYYVQAIQAHQNSIFILLDHDYMYQLSNQGVLIKQMVLPYTREKQVFNSLIIKNNQFYLGSKAGLYICDNTFQLIDQLNEQNGLRDQNINALHLSIQGHLWMALNNGIAYTPLGSELRAYHQNKGLSGLVEDLSFAFEKLYVATHSGVFLKNLENEAFTQVVGPKIQNQAWDLLTIHIQKKEHLLSISNEGVHQIFNTGTSNLIFEGEVYRLMQSKTNPHRVFIGLSDGLASIRYQNGKWHYEGYLLKTNYVVYNLDQEKNLIRIGDDPQGFYTELTLNEQGSKPKVLSHNTYTAKHGLPQGMIIPLGSYLGTNAGIYTQHLPGNFTPVTELNRLFTNKTPYVHRLSQDPAGNLWAVVHYNDTLEGQIKERQELGYFTHGLSGWSFVSGPFASIKNGKIDAVFHQDSNITWLAGTEGLFRFDKRHVQTYHKGYYTSITQIKSVNDNTLLFAGNFTDGKGRGLSTQDTTKIPQLPYRQNRLEFGFAAREYHDQEVLYAYFLEGYDKTFSPFLRKTSTLYKNIPEGTYTFYVKAKNRYGIISEAPTYTFTILPPWYRTWWAYVMYGLSTILLVLTVLLVWTKNLRSQVRQKTKEVVAQKEIIQEKNHDIMQSIAYAEKIQQSILPSGSFFKQQFTDSFVVFQPRDVVSGDFYWAVQQNQHVFFSVMDCTGHGVPGAFMSMIGNRGLNELVLDKQFNNPGIILTALRESLVYALSQDGSSPKRDGMDGALCRLDQNTLELHFAGANNGVFVVRKGSQPLYEKGGMQLEKHAESTESYSVYELKPQKMPIGYYPEKDEAFVSTIYQLLPTDTLYLTTDGYIDQFGGPAGKKFKKPTFIKQLIAVQHLDMHQQRAHLWQTMLQWMGTEHGQTDDICVMGIRV
jgi:serine phosphatase RsbU (regulator of sigma subunit)